MGNVSSISNPADFERQNQKMLLGLAGAKVGGTAGWVVNAANNLNFATVAASQTAGKLVIPITGLKVGSVITGFYLIGQIESAGGIVLLDADLRKLKAVAAEPVDASVGAITQISVTADTAVGRGNSRKADLSAVVNGDDSYYLLLTATTAASTDIILQGAVIEYTEH